MASSLPGAVLNVHSGGRCAAQYGCVNQALQLTSERLALETEALGRACFCKAEHAYMVIFRTVYGSVCDLYC